MQISGSFYKLHTSIAREVVDVCVPNIFLGGPFESWQGPTAWIVGTINLPQMGPNELVLLFVCACAGRACAHSGGLSVCNLTSPAF